MGSLLPAAEVPDKGSVYASEGTLAHSYLEKSLNGEDIKELFVTDSDMYSHVTEAKKFIEDTSGQTVMSEDKVIIARAEQDGFTCYGTVDAWAVKDGVLHVFDFKYGKGVKVTARWNSQMMLYAYGVLASERLSHIAVDEIQTHIVQPRMSNYSTFAYKPDDLGRWFKSQVTPRATLALSGDAPVVAGEWCRFCPLKGTCKATSFVNELNNTYKSLPAYEDLPVNEKIDVAQKAKEMVKWAEAVADKLLDDVIEGRIMDDRLSITEVKGRTKITDEAKAAAILAAAGIKNYSKSKLLPYGQLKQYADLLKEVIEVPVVKKLVISEAEDNDG
jgi:hypothetical protein